MEFLTQTQTAELLGRTVRQVRRYHGDRLTPIKCGKSVFYTSEEVIELKKNLEN